MSRFFKKILLIILVVGMDVATVHAGKIKSSKVYLEIIKKETSLLNSDIRKLKTVLNLNNQTGSFITTDFWGLKPHWYVKEEGRITDKYPFSDEWNRGQGLYGGAYKDLTADAVRNIKGVIFYPIQNKLQWRESVNISFNFNPGYSNPEHFKEGVTQYIEKTIPRNKQGEAFKFFVSKVSPLTDVIVKGVFKPMDRLYDGNGVLGDISDYRFVAKKLFEDAGLSLKDYFSPVKHGAVFTDHSFNRYGGHWKIKSRKALAAANNNWARKSSLWEYYRSFLSVTVEANEQHFIIAKDMTKNLRYNQLKKLQSILEKNVAEGKAKKHIKGEYIIYEDAKSNGRYKGHLSINFETGRGSWSMPILQAKKDIVRISTSIEKRVQVIDVAIDRYFSIGLKETIKKFQSTNLGKDDAQTDSF